MKNIVLLAILVSGCASSSELQFRLDQSSRNVRDLEQQNIELNAQLNALKAQKSGTQVACENTLTEVQKAASFTEDAAKAAYQAGKPLLIQGADNVSDWIKKKYAEHNKD